MNWTRPAVPLVITLVLVASASWGTAARAAEPPFAAPPELVQAATREGKLTVYTAKFMEMETELAKRFNRRFPNVKVEIVRAPTGQLVTRIKTEAAANKLGADIIELVDREQAIALTDLFAPYAPPNAQAYRPDTRSGDRLWPVSANAWTIAWNPQLVSDPPKSWQDLTKPQYAKAGVGLTVAISGGGPWNLAMFQRKILGEDYWAKLAATKPTLFPSQAPMADALVRGEVAVAPLVTDLAIPMQNRGAPVRWLFAPEGVPLTVFAGGLTRAATSPNAARLFLDWMLSREGQAAAVELGGFSSLIDTPLPPGVDKTKIKVWLPDRTEFAKLHDPWIAEWNKVFNFRQ
jgi:iron(III) transport system substrate-binding protein